MSSKDDDLMREGGGAGERLVEEDGGDEAAIFREECQSLKAALTKRVMQRQAAWNA
jgi:hypothetical protein